MKILYALLIICFGSVNAFSQSAKEKLSVPDTTKKLQVVELACGKCKFGMKGKECELAVRINGKSYYVDGADIDSFGDAHAKDGFCNAMSKAEVQGEIVGDRFKVTYLRLIKSTKKK